MILAPFFIILFGGLDPRVYATDFRPTSVCKNYHSKTKRSL